MTGLIPPGEWDALARPFQYSCFRLETLQAYAGSGEDEWIAAFERGDVEPPPDPEQDAWEAALREHQSAGRLVQRVHVVVEPLSDYLRYELAWAYAPNVAMGEDVRIATAGPYRSWLPGVPQFDFWLFDSSEMFEPRYDRDGTWLGVEQVTNESRIVAANRFRDAALHHAVPWWSYVKTRPDLLERVLPRYVPIEIL